MNAAPEPTVLHLVNTLAFGGVYRHVRDLADGLEQEGIRSRMAAWVPPGSPLRDDPRFTLLPLYRDAGEARSLRGMLYARRLLQRLLDEGVDVIHTHSRLAAMLAALSVGRRSRVRRLHTVHTNFPDLRSFPFYPKELIAVSDGLADAFRMRVRGMDRARIHVIHNGVDVPETPPRARSAGQDADARFLFVGRLVEQKGLPLLLRAMDAMSRDSIPALQIFGEGPLEQDLRRAASAGLPLHVEGFHPSPFTAARNAGADIRALLFPSQALEGLPYVLLESFASGIPVITANLPVLAGVVEHGVTGFVVPRNSPDAWADALRYAMAHPAEMRAMGERGEDLVRRSFRKDAMIQKTAAVYRRLCSA